jgi:hypothetical protein
MNRPNSTPPFPLNTEIQICQPQLAVLDRDAFELIADLPLFDDARGHSHLPALTLRSLLEPNGPRPAATPRMDIPIGLLKRVATMLLRQGCEVTVYGPGPLSLTSTTASTAVQAIDGRPYSLLQLPDEDQRLRVITAIREQNPEQHLLIVAKNKTEARRVAKRLRSAIGQRVTWGIEPRTNFPWTHVDAVNTFAGRSVVDWAYVVFWDAKLVISLTSLSQLSYMFGSFRVGFMTRDDRELHEVDRACVESMFGPVIYRPGDEHGLDTAITADWLPAPTYAASEPQTQLERKRCFLWRNGSRNGLMAAAARAISEGDSAALKRLGLEDAADWLTSRQAELTPGANTRLRIAIVVENLEHVRELSRLLPGWQEMSRHSLDEDLPIIDVTTIVTLPVAVPSTLVVDAVIYAAGIGTGWFDELGLACTGMTPEKMLVIDVADDFDPQSVHEVKARQSDYRRRGWSADEIAYAF